MSVTIVTKTIVRLFFSLLLGALLVAWPLDAARSANVELVRNGGFETGDLAGWSNTSTGGNFGYSINDGTFDPGGSLGPLAPISGNFDVSTSQTGPGSSTLRQSFLLPDSFTSLVLSWQDRIRSQTALADPRQEFRVNIRDASNGLIQTVFSTNPGDPSMQVGPNLRSFELAPLLASFAGQTVQLVFEQDVRNYYFPLALDNISLEAEIAIVPVPASLPLLAFGLGGLVLIRRKARR